MVETLRRRRRPRAVALATEKTLTAESDSPTTPATAESDNQISPSRNTGRHTLLSKSSSSGSSVKVVKRTPSKLFPRTVQKLRSRKKNGVNPRSKSVVICNVPSLEQDSTTWRGSASDGEESKKRQQSYDDDNDSIISTTSSLLPPLADDEGSIVSFDSSCYRGLSSIEKKLEMREQRLRHLVRGNRKSYERMLRAKEDASRECVLQGRIREQNGSHRSQSTRAAASPLQQILDFLLFESHLTLPGTLSLMFYCTAHVSFYALFDSFITWAATASTSFIDERFFHVLLIFSGTTLMRANGYLWFWLDDRSYKIVKFEMHNRAILKYPDARLMSYLTSTTTLNGALTMISFYSTYHGIQYFFYRWQSTLYSSPLDDWYNRTFLEATALLAENETFTCETIWQLPPTPFYRSILGYCLCVDCPDWNTICSLFSLCVCLLSIKVMSKLGQNFWQSFD
jgi:hypothetical protein